VARLTDEQLMERLQQGQTDALDELYSRYAKKLYVFCHNTTRSQSPQDAEDIVQDVFVRVIKAAHTFNPRRASFGTWVFRIARNRCIDVIRRQQRIQIVPIGQRSERDEYEEELASENELADQSESVESTLVRTSVVEAVRDCIDELENEDERQAILLYYLGGKVYREIGKVIGKSTSMARNRVKAAQDKVKRCLERKGIHSVV
jgi:RNA polymerase sigma-70 factor (ECF subfamily)